MRYTIPAGRYFGIPVKIHFTFPLILLAFGAEAWATGTWRDGVHAVLLILAVFVCVVLHEFGHSLQVKRYGIVVRDIILLPIGGMARAERIPENPWQEIVVAISGPLVNFALVGLFFGVLWLSGGSFTPGDDFVSELIAINLVLGLFNLIPAFPMDGGRVLRALLAYRFSYLRATHYARSVGQVIALGFVGLGFYYKELIMLPIIAVFIFFGAMSEENLVRARTLFEGRRVRDFMTDSEMFHLDDAIADVAAGTVGRHAVVPLTDDAHAQIAVVTSGDIMTAVGEGRGAEPVSTIASYDFPVLSADLNATQAYYFLKSERFPFAGVMDGERFAGLVYFSQFERAEPVPEDAARSASV